MGRRVVTMTLEELIRVRREKGLLFDLDYLDGTEWERALLEIRKDASRRGKKWPVVINLKKAWDDRLLAIWDEEKI